MSHKARNTLVSLFAHPVSSNIDPKDAYAMVEALGGEVTHGGHGQVMVRLNGHAHGFHDTKHSLSKGEVVDLRKFLETAGIDAVTALTAGAPAA